MKLVYTCALFGVLALTSWAKADYMGDVRARSKICQQEVKTTNEELEKFPKNAMNPAYDNDAIKCHIKCMMEKDGTFKNGELSEEGFEQSIQNTPSLRDKIDAARKLAVKCKAEKEANDCDTAFKIFKLGDKCKGEKVANDCDTAFKIFMCFRSNAAAMGLLPK